MRFSRFQSKRQLDAMFVRLPLQASLPAVTIAGFSQFKSKIGDLAPAERGKIDTVANRIVGGFRPGANPVIAVLVVGHADQDLSRGAAFERQISLDRANQAKDVLWDAVRKKAGAFALALQIKQIAVRTTGLGATQRLNVNPLSEAQRAANRRVVIFLAEADTPSFSLFDTGLLLPPQKKLAGSTVAPPARVSSLVGGIGPIFGSPALAGSAIFAEGEARRPAIKHDHGFLDDGNGGIDSSKREVPTERDLASKDIWMKVILGGALATKPDLRDATAAYRHFLVDNNGANATIRYEGFLTEDTNGQTCLKSAIADTRTGVLDVFDAKFPRGAPGPVSLKVVSAAVTVSANARYPYPASQNWQKAIGGHALWLSATATIDGGATPGRRTVSIALTLHAEDMYNFNPTSSDIATSVQDSENGRFEVTGLAHEFLQTGTATRTIGFTVPAAKQPDNRVEPPDQKVT